MADESSERIKQLEDRLSYLESVARDMVSRLYSIEQHLGVAKTIRPEQKAAPVAERKPHPPSQQADIAQPPAQPQTGGRERSEVEPPSTREPRAEANAQAPPPSYQRVVSPPREDRTDQPAHVPGFGRPALPSKRQTDLETRIGGNWFNRIGIIAIFFGVAFFLKYAVDNQWIGNTGRVLIGAAIGVAFLIAGEQLRKRYANYAYGLTGGGIAILYASIWFASFKRYDLLSPTVAFALMAVVTMTASLLAARYNALVIAVLGLIGGFLTPVLLSTGVDNEAGLFTYVAFLDAGVLALAYSKQWRSLNYLSFIATVLMFAAWWFTWYSEEKLSTTILFLTLFFVIFALLAVLHNVVNKRPTTWLDLALVFANGLLYFGTSYELMDRQPSYRSTLGLFAVLVAAFYLALGYFTYQRDREDKLLVFTFLGLGFLFSVLAVPIQFKQHWVTMGWAIEGAVMIWIGLRAGDRTSRYGALAVFVIALTHWVVVDAHDFSYSAGGEFIPLLNKRALSCAVLVAALAASAMFYKRYGDKLEERISFIGLLLLGANGLAVALLTIDANDYFEQRKALASGRDFVSSLANTKALTMTALWSIYGFAVLFVGVARRIKTLRLLGLLLLGGAAVKVLAIDLRYYDAAWHTPILNQTFGAFAFVVGALALGAWCYKRELKEHEDERAVVLPILIGAANVLAIIALSAEVIGHFDRVRAAMPASDEVDRVENTKQFVLSSLWTVYGAVALTLGIKRGARDLRVGALLLLALTVAKVLVIDLTYYDARWHTLVVNQTFATFALLVWALAWSARYYSRSELDSERERSLMAGLLVASANVLAIVALSAEALGYYEARLSSGELSSGSFSDLRLAQQLSLSVVWTIYGGAMLAAGLARRSKAPRMMALALLGLTILKVFLLDLSSLEKVYRIISFIVLGLILLAVSFLYQRYRQRVAEAIVDADAQESLTSE